MSEAIIKPIGMNKLTEHIENICNQPLYRHKKPPHLILQLDPGSGRTTCLQYVTEMFKAHRILSFSCGLDDWVEITLDASSSQKIQEGFSAFEAAAIYENQYSSVAGISIDGISKNISYGSLMKEFEKHVKLLSKTAYIVFFINSTLTTADEKLLQRIQALLGDPHIRRFSSSVLTYDEICLSIESKIVEYGMHIDDPSTFHSNLLETVFTCQITDLKDADKLTEAIMHFADFSKFPAIVTINTLSRMTKFVTANQKERSSA